MKKGVLSLIALAAAACACAQFTPGRLVVVVFGDGSAALNSNGTAAFLQEMDTAGALGINVAMPTTVSGSNRRLVVSGTSTSEGFLSRSVDGKYVMMTGYDANVADVNPQRQDATVVNRVVGRVAANATVDTSTVLTAYSGDGSSNCNIRSACSVDGTAFWTTGTSFPGLNAGIWYTVLAGASSNVVATPNNVRVAKIFNGQLYVSSASSGFNGISTVGSGTPTGTGETTTLAMDFGAIGTSPSPYDFYFADANTCYVTDDRTTANGGGVLKFAWDVGMGMWMLQYTINTGLPPSGVSNTGCRGLTGITVAGVTTLYATTAAGNNVVTVTDTGAASSFSTIATAATNTSYRGIAWAPENPSTPVTINPTAGTPGPGSTIGGAFANILASDDVRWEIRPGAILVATADPAVVVLDATAPGNNPTTLTVTVETSSSAANVRQIIEAKKFSDNTFTNLETFIGLPTAADRVVTLNIPNPSLHIGAGNALQLRMKAKNTTGVLVYPWRYKIDRVYWTYTP